MAKHLIMVYGTLKKGHGNNRLMRLGESRLVGECKTVDKFILMDFGGFPGLFPSGEGMTHTQVTGELWEVDDAVLPHLDALEGHPNWYRRTPIDVTVGQDKHECEVYMLHRKPHGTQCMDGIWPRAMKLQQA